MSYQPSDIEVALHGWASGVLAPVPVVFTRQDAPRPAGAFCALQLVALRPMGEPERVLTDVALGEDFAGELRHHHEGVVQVDLYGPGHAQAIEALVCSIEVPLVQEAALASGLSLVSSGTPTRADALAGPGWEGRTTCEFRFRFATLNTFQGQAIATVEATPDFLEAP